MTLYHHLIQRETSGLTSLKTLLILKVTCALGISLTKIHVECNQCRRIICFFMLMSYFYSVNHRSSSEQNKIYGPCYFTVFMQWLIQSISHFLGMRSFPPSYVPISEMLLGRYPSRSLVQEILIPFKEVIIILRSYLEEVSLHVLFSLESEAILFISGEKEVRDCNKLMAKYFLFNFRNHRL